MENFTKKDSIILVYTGDGKGKTSAGLGTLVRGLGAGFKVAFIQFIKDWDVSEHDFFRTIEPIYGDKLYFYKGGKGFYNAGKMSSSASETDHKNEAKKTFEIAYKAACSGEYQLVVCDEINNAVADGLLTSDDLGRLIKNKHPLTNLCLTGRNFPDSFIDKVDIVTSMTKLKHHFDDNVIANKGVDY